MRFTDRREAGRLLAERLAHVRGPHTVVLGLPRGGVVVAAEVADALGAPLDVVVVRKLGVPWQPELAMGALGEDGAVVHDRTVLGAVSISPDEVARVEAAERAELERRVAAFRAVRPRLPLDGRTAVVVDDGVATGSTARAACHVVRQLGAARVVLAVPVAPADFARRMSADADELVAVATPRQFHGVGQFYADFRQVGDDEVLALLRAASARSAQGEPGPPGGTPVEEEVQIPAGDITLPGTLTVPRAPRGVVVFAHGSGSGRGSPRNRAVARVLVDAGFATVLLDLLTPVEAQDRELVFDVPFLAERLAAAALWVRSRPELAALPLGFFGASTGAGAALWAAAEGEVQAVVSRGGRPDLASTRLHAVHAPTLLVVGEEDPQVLDLNRRARDMLVRAEAALEVVPGAGHLFEEPGALERVADLARDWFTRHLRGPEDDVRRPGSD